MTSFAKLVFTLLLLLSSVASTAQATEFDPATYLEKRLNKGALVIGTVEQAEIPEINLKTSARIDSGAMMTSLSAYNMHSFKKGEERWIAFNIPTETDTPKYLEKRIIDHVLVKQHGKPPLRRPVILLTLKLGSKEKTVKTTLTDRRSFNYQILIGRNFLDHDFLIDPSAKNLLSEE